MITEQSYWNRKPTAGQCFHCRRSLTDENTSDCKSLSLGPNAQWCDICAYITHPDGEGEAECDGSCAARAEMRVV